MLAKVVSGVIGGTVGYFAITAGAYMPFVISDASKEFNDNCEYLLVLGGDIIGADTPSSQLFERMKAAANYLNAHKDVIAVPCGGCFRELQKKSEAEIIAAYLIEQGVSADRIILEDKSTTTFENFEFGLKIIQNHANRNIDQIKIAFLSSNYHMHRAGVIAKQCGIKDVRRVSCITPRSAAKRFVREYFVGYDLLYRIIEKKIKNK